MNGIYVVMGVISNIYPLLPNNGCRTKGLRYLDGDQEKSRNLSAAGIMVELIWQPQLSLSLRRVRSENASQV